MHGLPNHTTMHGLPNLKICLTIGRYNLFCSPPDSLITALRIWINAKKRVRK